MKKEPKPKEPRQNEFCQQHKLDCFAYGRYGKCNALCNTDFPGECTFYKYHKEQKALHQKSIVRLKEIQRFDLIDKYSDTDAWKEIMRV